MATARTRSASTQHRPARSSSGTAIPLARPTSSSPTVRPPSRPSRATGTAGKAGSLAVGERLAHVVGQPVARAALDELVDEADLQLRLRVVHRVVGPQHALETAE